MNPQDPSAAPESTRQNGLVAALLLFAAATLDWRLSIAGVGIPAATAILAAVGVWLAIGHRRRLRLPLPWPIAIGIACVAFGFASGAAVSRGSLLRESFQFMEIFGLAYVAGALLAKDRGWPVAAAIVGLFVAMLHLLQVIEVAPTSMSWARTAALTAALSPFVLIQALRSPRFPTCACGLFTLLAGLPILLSLGDVSLLLPLAAAVCLLALRGYRPVQLGAVPAVCLLIVGTAAIHGFAAPKRFHGQFDRRHHTRLALEAEAAIQAPLTAPLGFGPGNYRVAINQLRQSVPELPHPNENTVARDANNQYLVTLVEAGPLAAVALAAMLLSAAFAKRAEAEPKDRATADAVCAAAAAFAVAACFATILGRGIGIAVGLVLGLAAARMDSASHPRRAIIPIAALAAAFAIAFFAPAISQTRLPSALAVAAPRLTVLSPDSAGAPDRPRIRVEGESYSEATGAFMRAAANDASGNAVLILPDGTGKAVGHATYPIEIPTAGRWRLAARVFWADGCANTLAFQINDHQCRVSSENFSRWHVLEAFPEMRLPAGAVDVRIQNVEDGVRLDWFELEKLD